ARAPPKGDLHMPGPVLACSTPRFLPAVVGLTELRHTYRSLVYFHPGDRGTPYEQAHAAAGCAVIFLAPFPVARNDISPTLHRVGDMLYTGSISTNTGKG